MSTTVRLIAAYFGDPCLELLDALDHGERLRLDASRLPAVHRARGHADLTREAFTRRVFFMRCAPSRVRQRAVGWFTVTLQ
jgi:hypothetical protein